VPFRLVGRAEDRIDAVLLESARQWGIDAAARYIGSPSPGSTRGRCSEGFGCHPWAPRTANSLPLPRIGSLALTAESVALIVKARAVTVCFGRHELGGHGLKRSALTTGMDRGVHSAKFKSLRRHESFDVLGEYLEFGDLFDGHLLKGVL